MRYRLKIPHEIEAVQYKAGSFNPPEWWDKATKDQKITCSPLPSKALMFCTPLGYMFADDGDYLVFSAGVLSIHHVDNFEATYEPVPTDG